MSVFGAFPYISLSSRAVTSTVDKITLNICRIFAGSILICHFSSSHPFLFLGLALSAALAVSLLVYSLLHPLPLLLLIRPNILSIYGRKRALLGSRSGAGGVGVGICLNSRAASPQMHPLWLRWRGYVVGERRGEGYGM